MPKEKVLVLDVATLVGLLNLKSAYLVGYAALFGMCKLARNNVY